MHTEGKPTTMSHLARRLPSAWPLHARHRATAIAAAWPPQHWPGTCPRHRPRHAQHIPNARSGCHAVYDRCCTLRSIAMLVSMSILVIGNDFHRTYWQQLPVQSGDSGHGGAAWPPTGLLQRWLMQQPNNCCTSQLGAHSQVHARTLARIQAHTHGRIRTRTHLHGCRSDKSDGHDWGLTAALMALVAGVTFLLTVLCVFIIRRHQKAIAHTHVCTDARTHACMQIRNHARMHM